MSERMDTCASCRFYDPPGTKAGDRRSGECRRRAPTVMDRAWDHSSEGRQHKTATVWPETKSDDWCGDYELRRG